MVNERGVAGESSRRGRGGTGGGLWDAMQMPSFAMCLQGRKLSSGFPQDRAKTELQAQQREGAFLFHRSDRTKELVGQCE
jgi:hypothetical protein